MKTTFCKYYNDFRLFWNYALIPLILIALSLGQFEQIGNGIYIHDIFAVTYVLTNIKNVKALFNDKTKFGWLFILFASISFLLNIIGKPFDSTILAAGYLIRWSLYYLIYCVISADNSTVAKWLNKGLIIYIASVLIIGLAQWVFFPDMRMLSYLGWDDHYYRLIGSWLDPNYTGLIFVLGLFKVVEMLSISKSKPNRLRFIAFIGLLLTGLLLTYSRSSYLALVTGFVFLFRWRLGAIVSLLAGIIIISYAVIVPKPAGEGGNLLRTVSIDSRIRSYRRGIEIFKTSPIYGVGFNYYKYAQEKANYIPSDSFIDINSASGNDNSFILILATTGIVGLALFLVFWMNIFLVGNPLVKASISAITIHSFFNNSIFFPAVILWIWIVIGNLNKKSKVIKHL